MACQAPRSVEFPRQEYWSGFPTPGDLPDPGVNPHLQLWQAASSHQRHLGSPCLLLSHSYLAPPLPFPPRSHLFVLCESAYLLQSLVYCVFKIPHRSEIMRYLSFSDFFHLASMLLDSPSPSMLLQMAKFYSFYY